MRVSRRGEKHPLILSFNRHFRLVLNTWSICKETFLERLFISLYIYIYIVVSWSVYGHTHKHTHTHTHTILHLSQLSTLHIYTHTYLHIHLRTNSPKVHGIIHFDRVRLFTFYTLPDTRVLNSFEELCIMRAAAVNSFVRVLNPHGRAYISSSTDRLFRCITTLQCG